jgi:parvulin-like peptidyl-prolyl isomerase
MKARRLGAWLVAGFLVTTLGMRFRGPLGDRLGRGTRAYPAKVGGRTIGQNAWQEASRPDRTETAEREAPLQPDQIMDRLIGREIFAQAGAALGLEPTGRSQARAVLMRRLLHAVVRRSREEILTEYIYDQTQATIHFVKFPVSGAPLAPEPTAAELAAYLASHEADVKERFKTNEAAYKNVRPMVRAHHVIFRKAHAREAKARRAAQVAWRQLQRGASFAEILQRQADGEYVQGGDLGWRPADSLGWEAALSEAVAKQPIGRISDIIETTNGFHIVRVDERREGDLTYVQLRRELATELWRAEKRTAWAQTEAQRALDRVRRGTLFEVQFERAGTAAKSTDEIRTLGDRPQWDRAIVVLHRDGIVSDRALEGYVGRSLALYRAIFVALDPGEVGPEPYVLEDGSVVLVRLIEREDADRVRFTRDESTLAQRLHGEAAARVIAAWLSARCVELRDRRQIEVNRAYVSAEYQPCQRL